MCKLCVTCSFLAAKVKVFDILLQSLLYEPNLTSEIRYIAVTRDDTYLVDTLHRAVT